ncbi:hypothetical protein, partial [Streptomyces sp. NPDC102462]|uniref:hypothetical protein n=1 Tax=Streptomyces sp. NPDC102462 TaxID=3366178 RepID=UPI0037F79D25
PPPDKATTGRGHHRAGPRPGASCAGGTAERGSVLPPGRWLHRGRAGGRQALPEPRRHGAAGTADPIGIVIARGAVPLSAPRAGTVGGGRPVVAG